MWFERNETCAFVSDGVAQYARTGMLRMFDHQDIVHLSK